MKRAAAQPRRKQCAHQAARRQYHRSCSHSKTYTLFHCVSLLPIPPTAEAPHSLPYLPAGITLSVQAQCLSALHGWRLLWILSTMPRRALFLL